MLIGSNPSLALFILRIALGSVFVLHGMQKVFGLFGGEGLQHFVQWLATMGVPAWLGYVAAFGELVSGCMLLLGIYAQLGALIVLANMIVAIYLVHWGHGYFLQTGGLEYSLTLLLMALSILVGGPGAYSII